MRLTDHVSLNFNISTAAIFFDIEKAFDITWCPGLLYKLSELQFSANLIKLISPFLTNRNFRVAVEGELFMPRKIQAEVPQGSVLALTLYNLYINDVRLTPGVQLALITDDTCIYATERKEGYVLRNSNTDLLQ
jgi:hypothetical protein